MAHELEVELEDDVIEPITDEPYTQLEPPITDGHLPFSEMGIVPPLDDRVMGSSNLTFD